MARKNNSSDSKKYFDWLKFAGADMEAARLLRDSGHCNDLAAFHCQQCIEKSLKAYVLFRELRLLDGHNLTWLCRQAARINPKFNAWLDESAKLNRYYIQTRYPSDIKLEINNRSVARIYTVARDMYDFICLEVYGPGDTSDDD